ncbi:MAG TPA: helix-turn-helix domain-containing protein [Euzebyales bacterium]|nr:helix-turn-helix domain-containing protein [Euzebyales bacterium]
MPERPTTTVGCFAALTPTRDRPPEPLLSPEEARRLIGVGRTKVYELLRVGAVESVRIGRCCRIPHAALAAYVGAALRRSNANSRPTRRNPMEPVGDLLVEVRGIEPRSR